MDVGILTYHDSDNFGSVLQCFALSRYLLLRGHSCRVIDLRKPEVQALYSIMKPLSSRYNLLTDLYHLPHMAALKQRKARFEDFRRQWLPLTDTCYETGEQVPQEAFSCYVTGSDQVWNVGICDFDPVYMLRGMKGKKVSYAASFGPIATDRKMLEPYRQDLLALDAVSLREASAEELCREMGVQATVVCDPVFLPERKEYEAAAVPCPIPGKYMLCYFPGGTPRVLERYSRDLAKRLGLERVLLMSEWRNAFRSGKKCYSGGPGEFLYLMQNASCVCTSSFHGTAFSLVFGKECYVYNTGNDSRTKTLLSLVSGVEQPESYISRFSADAECGELHRHIAVSKKFIAKEIG